MVSQNWYVFNHTKMCNNILNFKTISLILLQKFGPLLVLFLNEEILSIEMRVFLYILISSEFNFISPEEEEALVW